MVQTVLHGRVPSKDHGIATPDSLFSGDSNKSTAQRMKEKNIDSTVEKG